MTQLNLINFKNVFVYEIGLIANHKVSPQFGRNGSRKRKQRKTKTDMEEGHRRYT